MHIVISGNPADGLTFWGPFEDADRATEWGEQQNFGEGWWVVPLQEVE